MANKKRKQADTIDLEKEKNVVYFGALPLSYYRQNYYVGFHYNYWMHKALALESFVKNPERIKELHFSLDRDTDEYIVDNLKMEVHMMVFHSAESLLLHLLGRYFFPDCPWCWVSNCKQWKARVLISMIAKESIASIIPSPEQWLRDVLYPTIKEGNEDYEKTKLSSAFVRKYVDRLADEYVQHEEYNSYKHGLSAFPGQLKLEAIEDNTGIRETLHDGDAVFFLECDNSQESSNMKVQVKSSNKPFKMEVDLGIIETTSMLLLTLFERERMNYKATKGGPQKFNVVFFDDRNLDEIFRYGLKKFKV